MLTVVETLLFQKQWSLYWTEENAASSRRTSPRTPRPEMWCLALVVSVRSAGAGRVRGKSGGVRAIYFTRTAEEELVLLTLYAKSTTDNLTAAKLKEIRRALEG